jgi:hypothetical protein
MFPCTPAVMQEEHAVCVVFLNCRIFRKNCLFVESAILWGCAGYFALKYNTRQRAGAEFMPITKLELGQYRIILSADTASEVRQMPSQKRR